MNRWCSREVEDDLKACTLTVWMSEFSKSIPDRFIRLIAIAELVDYFPSRTRPIVNRLKSESNPLQCRIYHLFTSLSHELSLLRVHPSVASFLPSWDEPLVQLLRKSGGTFEDVYWQNIVLYVTQMKNHNQDLCHKLYMTTRNQHVDSAKVCDLFRFTKWNLFFPGEVVSEMFRDWVAFFTAATQRFHHST